MKVSGQNPETGEQIAIESDKVDTQFVESMSATSLPDSEIKRIIDNLDISADAKTLIYQFSKATIRAGQFIVKIGRKIVDFVCMLYREYPGATFGMIFGAIAGFLVAAIPLLGAVLGPIFGPIAIIFGLAKGLNEDLRDKALQRKVAEINAGFAPLAG